MREYREFTMKTIMVAMDFSGASYGALHYSKDLATHFSAKILLVHVVDVMRSALEMKQPVLDAAQEMDTAEQNLEKIYTGLHYDGVRCAMVVRRGSIREEVLNLVNERNVDLLVIGTRGHGYKNGEGLGSVAESLLRSMPCPVLTVGTHVRQDACENTHRHTVLFPTDFSDVSRESLAYTECLTKYLAGRLLLMHVDKDDADAARCAGHKDEFQHLIKGIKEPSLIDEMITRVGRPAETIVAISSERQADFIVMGVHGFDQADGIAFDVIRSARCPVFTLFTQPEKEMTEVEEFRRQQQRLSR